MNEENNYNQEYDANQHADEAAFAEEKYYRCIDGLYRKNKIIGYCRCDVHIGALTVKLLKQHECLIKQCPFLVRFKEHSFWTERERQKNLAKSRRKSKYTREYGTDSILEKYIRRAEECVENIPNMKIRKVEHFGCRVRLWVYTPDLRNFKSISEHLTKAMGITVVLRRVDLSYTDKRIENELFLRFKNHYDFRVEYCRSKSPNQKGHVEGKVGYLRRNLFVPMPVIDDIDEYNRELLMRCMILHNRKHHRTKQSIVEMFNSYDVQALLPMPKKDFEVATILERKVDREGRVRFNGQKYYYLEPRYAKKKVQVKITYNKVIFYDKDNNLIAEFDRLYGDKKFTAIHWEKWLPTISRKPNSLFHSSLTDMFTERLREFLLNGSSKIRGIYMKAICELMNSMPLDRAICVVDIAAGQRIEEYDLILRLGKV